MSGQLLPPEDFNITAHALFRMKGRRYFEPRDERLRAMQLQLGVMLAPQVFACKFACSDNVSIAFLNSRRMIRIQFRREYEAGAVEYQMELRIQELDIGCITVSEDDTATDTATDSNESTDNTDSTDGTDGTNTTDTTNIKTKWITINMKIPPSYWRFTRKPPSDDGSSRGGQFNLQTLRRVIDLRAVSSSISANRPGTPTMSNEPSQPDPPSQNVKLGKWLVVRLEVDAVRAHRVITAFLKKAQEFNLYWPAAKKVVKITEVRDYTQRTKLSWLHFGIRLRFDVHYLLESVLSYNLILQDNMTCEFVSLLQSIEPAKACIILENIISRRLRIWDPLAFLQREAKRMDGVPAHPRMVPPHNVLLRKVIITPTTMYLLPPIIETSNRIIRKYQEYQDYFLRVEFADEGPDKICFREGQVNLALFNRIYSTLVNGVKIADRVYEFLAFSSSQLRENAAWFFCSNGGKNPTPVEIRNWMGDFSRIKSIAKYGARMGQCFSSTRPITELTSEQVTCIDDIERDGSIFTDGCGLISPALAEFIRNRLDKDVVPSAFQIRLGGSKGVLAIAPPEPENKSGSSDFWVAIRPSMNKFDSNHYVLEVIKTSSFIPSYLNRQIIVLLSALGVPDKVFLDLKDQMVHEFDQMETDDIIAYRILAQQWDESGTYRMMAALIQAGFLKTGDIFLKNLLKLCKHQMLEDLAKRARIYVPQGAYLLGVVDESDILEEDQIFVQVSDIINPSKRRIIQGECIIVRSPCFHPGDIRVVRAVDNQHLHHLHDVVVFNTKGRRSLPSMCSGGDLDGDEFTIIWDPNIVKRVQQQPPMEYHGQETLIKNDITIRDIQSFFVQYAVSNNLGLIANAHLSFSDQLAKGPFDGKCLRLAQLHSDAVDFPKTGKPAEMNNELRPKLYPDFMGKTKDRSYRSDRILGKLYRECSNHESFDSLQEELKIDERLLVDGYVEFLDDARALKERYDHEVRSLTNHYGIKTDIEVASGFIMGMETRSNKREHENRQTIAKAYSSIRRMFRALFDHEFHESPTSNSSHLHANQQLRMEQKASAWYAVSYEDWSPGQYYTFGWIVWDILCKIAEKKSRPENASDDKGYTEGNRVKARNLAADAAFSALLLSRMRFATDNPQLRANNPQEDMEYAIAMARARVENDKKRLTPLEDQTSQPQISPTTAAEPILSAQQHQQDSLPRRGSGMNSGDILSIDDPITINTPPLIPLSQGSQESCDSDEMDLFPRISSLPLPSRPQTTITINNMRRLPLSTIRDGGARVVISAADKAAHFRRHDAIIAEAFSQASMQLALLDNPPASPNTDLITNQQGENSSKFDDLLSSWDDTSSIWPSLNPSPAPQATDPSSSFSGISSSPLSTSSPTLSSSSLSLSSPSLPSSGTSSLLVPIAAPVVLEVPATVSTSNAMTHYNSFGMLVIGPDVSCEGLANLLGF